MTGFEALDGHAGAGGKDDQRRKGEKDEAGSIGEECAQRLVRIHGHATEWRWKSEAPTDLAAIESHGLRVGYRSAPFNPHRADDDLGQWVWPLASDGDVSNREQDARRGEDADQDGPTPAPRPVGVRGRLGVRGRITHLPRACRYSAQAG